MKEKWLLTFWAWKMRGWLGVVDDTYLGKYSVWDAIGNLDGQKIWPRIICCLSPLVQLYYEMLFLCNFTYVIHPPGITLLYHLSFFFFFLNSKSSLSFKNLFRFHILPNITPVLPNGMQFPFFWITLYFR